MADMFDYLFVGGIIVILIAFTSFLNAFSSSQTPRSAILFLILGVGMVGYPAAKQPRDYSMLKAPEIVVRVVADLIR